MRICKKANNLKIKSKGAVAMENKLEKIGQLSYAGDSEKRAGRK